jgi:hypothetical protein
MAVGWIAGRELNPDTLTVVGLVTEVPSLLRPQRLQLRQREISCKESRTTDASGYPLAGLDRQ